MPQPAEGLASSLLNGLSKDEVQQFYSLAKLHTFEDNDVIISEGDAGDAMFVVVSGRVRVEKATLDQQQEVITFLGEWECFGEMSLVDREPRSATVRALGQTQVQEFPQDTLDVLFEAHPDMHRRILINLSQIGSQRIRRLDETLVQSVYDSVILLDSNYLVLQWKRLTDKQDIVEGASDEAIGRDLFDLVPQLGEGVKQTLIQVMDSAELAVLPLEMEMADGRTAYFEVTIAPQGDGSVRSGLILGLRDITDTKSLETRLIQAEKLAMVGQMSAEIGHELKNYLTVVVGHTDLLLANPEIQQLERPTRSLTAISNQLDRMSQFATELMDLGLLRSKTEESDLNLLIERLVQFIQGQSRFRRVEFDLDLSADLPKLQIDQGQFQQVLLNLFANAADAMGQGVVQARTRYDREQNRLVLVVADTGPGMPEEVKARIFESGFTTKDTGHGFGLAVCLRIIENHGGEVEV